jgi:hypothetical protein
LIGTVFALALLAMHGDATPTPDGADESPAIDVDSCLDVDQTEVRKLLTLELPAAHAGNAKPSISVRVACTDRGQEIRVEPWASRGEEGVREIELPAADDTDPAAGEARSRELALAIAELIRRLEITHPLVSPAPPPPPSPAPANPPIVVAQAPPHDGFERRWLIGVQSSFEAFTGGERLAGGDLLVAARLGRWILGEVRIGGRVVATEDLPSGRLTSRAGTAAVAAGLNLWSNHRSVAGALLVRAQGYLVEYRADLSGDGNSRSALLGAFVVAVEPRLLIALTRRVSLTAAAAAGIPVHGIVVRTQGLAADSLSGVAFSGNLGAVLTFDR